MIIAFIAVVLLIFILISIIPAKMAKKRGRSFAGWFWFTFILLVAILVLELFPPLFCTIVLLMNIIVVAALGDTEERRKQKIWEQERIRQMAERQYSRKTEKYVEPEEPFFNPNAKTINDMYKGKNIKDIINNS